MKTVKLCTYLKQKYKGLTNIAIKLYCRHDLSVYTKKKDECKLVPMLIARNSVQNIL